MGKDKKKIKKNKKQEDPKKKKVIQGKDIFFWERILNRRFFVFAFHILVVAVVFLSFGVLREYEISRFSEQCKEEIAKERSKSITSLFKIRKEEAEIKEPERVDLSAFDLSGIEFSKKVPTLMYHYIDDDVVYAGYGRRDLTVLTSDFDGQMKWLADNGYTAMTATDYFGDIASGRILPEKPILLTFDDGYRDFYDKAFPILKKYGHKATVFIISGSVDLPAYMTWDQLKEIKEYGIELGSHTVAHPNLMTVKDDKLIQELQESKRSLEDNLGVKVNFLCYPSGLYDQRILHQVKEVGYKGAFTIYNGYEASNLSLLELPRYKIFNGMALEEFQKIVESANNPIGN